MAKKTKTASCCSTLNSFGCCNVESVVTVDERGQMVLPKEIRDKANIKPGDKLTIISWKKDEKVCCLSLIRAEDFVGMVKELLGPMFQEIASQGGKK